MSFNHTTEVKIDLKCSQWWMKLCQFQKWLMQVECQNINLMDPSKRIVQQLNSNRLLLPHQKINLWFPQTSCRTFHKTHVAIPISNPTCQLVQILRRPSYSSQPLKIVRSNSSYLTKSHNFKSPLMCLMPQARWVQKNKLWYQARTFIHNLLYQLPWSKEIGCRFPYRS